jgi:catechol 2,3-dioxygenase-like lactoylglutathione lyase family enzyme
MSAAVRYIVEDVDAARDFYVAALGFESVKHNSGKFAELHRDGTTLYLNAPGAGSGGQAGGVPVPGGWNRMMIVTRDLEALISRARQAGAKFRGGVSAGGAGRAILVEDPSGNPVELFEFK